MALFLFPQENRVATITVKLLKPSKHTTITYQGSLVFHQGGHILIHAKWENPAYDLGYVVFEPGDHFYEHYYTDRWFNIFVIFNTAGALKGWYCNVTRPAEFDGSVIRSEDLELDLFVSPDRQQLLRLDLDEFAARNFDQNEPATHAAALAALDELEQMARQGIDPFNRTSLVR